LMTRVDENADAVAVVRELTEQVNDLGMQLDVQFDDLAPAAPPSTHAVVVLGSPVTASALSAVTGPLATLGANIDPIPGIAAYPAPAAPRSPHAVVVLGSPVTASAFSAVTGSLATIGASIDSIRGIADYPVTGLELHVSTVGRDAADDSLLRETLAPLADAHG